MVKIGFIFRKEAESGSPYDGVFSFSQGASLGAYLCVLQQMGKLNAEFKSVKRKRKVNQIKTIHDYLQILCSCRWICVKNSEPQGGV